MVILNINSFRRGVLTPQLLIIFSVLLVSGFGVGYFVSLTSTSGNVDTLKKELDERENRLAEANAKIDELMMEVGKFKEPQKFNPPNGWFAASPVIPMMGQHYVNRDLMPLGPIILTSSDGTLLGIEYMFTLDMMDNKTEMSPEGMVNFLQISNLMVRIPDLNIEAVVDHIDVEYLPGGHDGFEVPHFDVHIYFVDKSTLAELTT